MTYNYGVLPIGTAEIAKARNWELRRSGPAGSVRTVAQAVAHQAEHAPGRLAVVDGDARSTYDQLWRRANATAALLRRAGCQAGDVVAVCGPRSAALIVAWLAIECCQAIYLPLEERWPARRLAELVTSSGAAFILSLSEQPDDNDPGRVAAKSTGAQFLVTADDGDGPAAPVPGLAPDRACYLIYTSGSTGVPKGVLIEQRGLLNHLRAKVTDLGLDERGSVALTAPLAFDISIWQMLAPLLVGGAVHVVRAADDPAWLVDELARLSTSVVELVPAVIGLVLDELSTRPDASPLPDLRWLLATGEELPPGLAARCLDSLPHVRLMNAYGPAECSDDVTHHVLSGNVADRRHLPIGGPVINTALYVLRWDDSGWAACAPGEPGELFVGGHGVGRGYLADPGRTAEAFFADPFDPDSPTGRLYRTGDMARVAGDGILEYLGRADRQVKVAGVRIELAEIEAVLRQHPAIQACAVTLMAREPAVALVARETRLSGSRELAAYYVGQPVSSRDLAHFLRERLPGQSVPRRWSRLDSLPVTPNGKVDYGALPLPQDQDWPGRRELPPPTDAMERVVFDAALEVLGTGWADGESFVGLGGDSLRAMVLAARLRAAGHRVSVRDILTAGSITQLAKALKPADPDVPTPRGNGPGDGVRTRDLTPEQQGVYFQWRLEPDSPYYTYQGVLRIAGPVDWTRLAAAWSALLDENPNLLARITEEDGGAGAVQHFPVWSIPLSPPEDLSPLAQSAGEAAFRERAARAAALPFLLGQEPILRVAGFRLGEEDYRLLLTMHEILLDGWGAMVLIQRLGALYAGNQTAAEPDRRGRFERYLDYREDRLRAAETRQAGEYWRKELDGDLPVLDLPAAARSGHSSGEYRGRTVERVLDGEAHAQLMRTCRMTGCTPFMVAVAGYALSLGFYTGADEVVIGAPIANREDQERIDIPTFSLNMLPLIIEMPPGRTLAGHLAHIQRKVTDAYAAAGYPFAWMLQESRRSRSGPRTPVFQTMLNALMYPAEPISVTGARWAFTELDTGYTKYDCALYLQRHGPDGLSFQFVHQDGLLPGDLAGSLLESVLIAISAISARRTETIGTVDLLTRSHHIALAEPGHGGSYDPI
jgi:amino acid adenylation domain-containing protein